MLKAASRGCQATAMDPVGRVAMVTAWEDVGNVEDDRSTSGNDAARLAEAWGRTLGWATF